MPTQLGKDQPFGILIDPPSRGALLKCLVFRDSVRAFPGRAANQKKFVNLLLFPARLFALISGKLAMPKVGKDLAALPGLGVASLLLLSLPLKIIALGNQPRAAFSANRFADRRDVKFRAGYSYGCLLDDLLAAGLDLDIERTDLRANLRELRRDRLQTLQFGFFEALAQAQQRRKCEMKWHSGYAGSAIKDLIACLMEVLSSFLCCRKALIAGNAATAWSKTGSPPF